MGKLDLSRLGEFCFGCRERISEDSDDGGRCEVCLCMLESATQEDLEKGFALLPDDIRVKIIEQMF